MYLEIKKEMMEEIDVEKAVSFQPKEITNKEKIQSPIPRENSGRQQTNHSPSNYTYYLDYSPSPFAYNVHFVLTFLPIVLILLGFGGKLFANLFLECFLANLSIC